MSKKREQRMLNRRKDEPFVHVFCEEVKVGVPFVANDLPA